VRQSVAEVVAVDRIGSLARVCFAAPTLARALEPGRAILIESNHAYLRRAEWPCAIAGDTFSILVSADRADRLRIGESRAVLGPIGRGFRIEDAGRNILLVASGASVYRPDIGPLLALLERVMIERRSVTLAYAATSSDAAYPIAELPPAIEVIRTLRADADLIDRLPDAIVWADQVFACGPIDFAARLAERIEAIRVRVPRGFAQILHPVDLPCGAGACGLCRNGSRLACSDGPVFELAEKLRKS